MTDRASRLIADALRQAAAGFATELRRGPLLYSTPDGYRAYRTGTGSLSLVGRESELSVTLVGVDLSAMT